MSISEKYDWTTDKVSELILLYEQRPVLWDTRHSGKHRLFAVMFSVTVNVFINFVCFELFYRLQIVQNCAAKVVGGNSCINRLWCGEDRRGKNQEFEGPVQIGARQSESQEKR